MEALSTRDSHEEPLGLSHAVINRIFQGPHTSDQSLPRPDGISQPSLRVTGTRVDMIKRY